MDSNCCDSGLKNSSKPIHIRLMDFAMKMGFTGKFDEACFKMMCMKDMTKIFEHLLTMVHPAGDVEQMKKMAFLESVKQSDLVHKSGNKQFNLAKRKAALESQVSARYKKIADKEEECDGETRRMSKLWREVQQLASGNEDYKKKTFLLKMNASLINDKLSRCERFLSRTRFLTTSLNLKKKSLREESREILHHCEELVGSFLEESWHLYGSESRCQNFQDLAQFHERKKNLKCLMRKSAGEASATELMEAMIELQQDLNAHILSLVSSVDLERDANFLKSEHKIDSSGHVHPGILKLASLHLQYEAERDNLKITNALKQKEFATLKEGLLQHLPEQTKNVVDSQLSLKILSSKKKYLEEELQKLETKLRDLGYFQWTYQKHKEEIIALDVKRSWLLNFISQNINRTQICKLLALAQEKKVLSRLKSIEPQCFQTVQYSVKKLQRTVAEEVKLFLNNPIYIFQQISLPDGSVLPSYKMLVNYQDYMPETEGELALYGAPTDPIEDIVMKVYQQKCFYFMLQWTQSQDQQTNLPVVESRAEEFQKHLSSLSSECEDLQAALLEGIDSSELEAGYLQNSQIAWERLSFLSVLYDLPPVEGKTFQEWLQQYENLLELNECDESFTAED